jgi:hypothetical protein
MTVDLTGVAELPGRNRIAARHFEHEADVHCGRHRQWRTSHDDRYNEGDDNPRGGGGPLYDVPKKPCPIGREQQRRRTPAIKNTAA